MTALYLVLVLCGPAGCHVERLPADSLLACMRDAQIVAADRWPGERLARWACEAGERV